MLKVNNWSSLQSYKDRKPPWIRLHKTLLDNFEFHSMSKNARALLPMLWLLASEHEDPTSGIIKYNNDQISFRLRISKKELDSGISECIESGFIQQYQPCKESVTKPLQDCNKTVPPETETEAEEETKIDIECEFEKRWELYPKKDGKKEALRHFKATIKTTSDLISIDKALSNYVVSTKDTKKQYIKNGSTWFNNWEDWVEWTSDGTTKGSASVMLGINDKNQ